MGSESRAREEELTSESAENAEKRKKGFLMRVNVSIPPLCLRRQNTLPRSII
jgi:hypothetical protein